MHGIEMTKCTILELCLINFVQKTTIQTVVTKMDTASGFPKFKIYKFIVMQVVVTRMDS